MYLTIEGVFLWNEFFYLSKQQMGSNPKCFPDILCMCIILMDYNTFKGECLI